MNRRRGTVLMALGIIAGMVGLTFASVPLYQLFCKVTGYGGTTQTAAKAPGAAGERRMIVRFNADRARDLDWRFQPQQREVTVRLGEETLAFYTAENLSRRPVTGVATFNVTPDKAGIYFSKIACFCFERQRLEPGQQVEMPVSFFVDPALAEDPKLADVHTITLSYTFFPAPDEPVKLSKTDHQE